MRKIDKVVRNAEIIVQFMRDDLNFEVSHADVAIGKKDGVAEAIHIRLDVDKQVFFKPFFDNLKSNYQLLMRDNKRSDSVKLIRHVKSDLTNLLKEQILLNDSREVYFHFVNL